MKCALKAYNIASFFLLPRNVEKHVFRCSHCKKWSVYKSVTNQFIKCPHSISLCTGTLCQLFFWISTKRFTAVISSPKGFNGSRNKRWLVFLVSDILQVLWWSLLDILISESNQVFLHFNCRIEWRWKYTTNHREHS